MYVEYLNELIETTLNKATKCFCFDIVTVFILEESLKPNSR